MTSDTDRRAVGQDIAAARRATLAELRRSVARTHELMEDLVALDAAAVFTMWVAPDGDCWVESLQSDGYHRITERGRQSGPPPLGRTIESVVTQQVDALLRGWLDSAVAPSPPVGSRLGAFAVGGRVHHRLTGMLGDDDGGLYEVVVERSVTEAYQVPAASPDEAGVRLWAAMRMGTAPRPNRVAGRHDGEAGVTVVGEPTLVAAPAAAGSGRVGS